MIWRSCRRRFLLLIKVMARRITSISAAIDAMEIVVDDNHWPVPTYNEILFYC